LRRLRELGWIEGQNLILELAALQVSATAMLLEEGVEGERRWEPKGKS
jgi:hypothetical protein